MSSSLTPPAKSKVAHYIWEYTLEQTLPETQQKVILCMFCGHKIHPKCEYIISHIRNNGCMINAEGFNDKTTLELRAIREEPKKKIIEQPQRSSSSSSSSSSENLGSDNSKYSSQRGVNQEQQSRFNFAFARFIYSSGSALRLCENEDLFECFRIANPDLKIPPRNSISNSLLDNLGTECQEKIDQEDKEVIREGFAQRRRAHRNRRKEGKPKPMVAQHASVHHPGCCNHGNDDHHVHHPDLKTHALILQDEELCFPLSAQHWFADRAGRTRSQKLDR
jgi:hypothetical protein